MLLSAWLIFFIAFVFVITKGWWMDVCCVWEKPNALWSITALDKVSPSVSIVCALSLLHLTLLQKHIKVAWPTCICARSCPTNQTLKAHLSDTILSLCRCWSEIWYKTLRYFKSYCLKKDVSTGLIWPRIKQLLQLFIFGWLRCVGYSLCPFQHERMNELLLTF